MRLAHASLALLALSAGAIACNDDSNSTSSGITLALGANTASVATGAQTTMNITVGRAGGFGGAVTLTAEGLPTGVTATFAPATVAAGAGATSSVLTLSATGGAVVGAKTVTVRAVGSGVSDATTTFTLNTTAGVAQGLTVSLTPATLPITRGATATSTITIVRMGGFTGDATLTATGLPSGVTASFAPATLTGGTLTSTLTLTATGAATTGLANVVIHANGTAITEQTASIALTVN